MKGKKSYNTLADIVQTAKEEERKAILTTCASRMSALERYIINEKLDKAPGSVEAKDAFARLEEVRSIIYRIQRRGATDLHAIKDA